MRRPAALPPASLLDYGAIGDLRSAALVSRHGSVDWLCWPRMDSPSVFAALLDPAGGHLRVAPAAPYESAQSYEPQTNVLRTTFSTATGKAVLTAFMPVQDLDGEECGDHEIHLLLEVLEGQLAVAVEFAPRFDYARAPTTLAAVPHGILAQGGGERLALSSDIPLETDGTTAHGGWDAQAGDRFWLVLRHDDGVVRPCAALRSGAKLEAARAYWRAWCARGRFDGPWQGAVERSALALKLLTYAPTGALAAAATTSLPEAPGGPRNWDYRYSWVRDSAFTVRVLHSLGYAREARRYLGWLRRLLRGTLRLGELRVCYGLEGEADLPETELPHLRGYLDSRPVRIGNEAAQQSQLDIFGSLADAVHTAYQTPHGHPDEAWRTLRAIADHVVRHWEEPDHGIWEVRGPRRRYTHSALMSWVALDRAIKVGQEQGHPCKDWEAARERIRDAICTQGWSARRNAFAQSFGSDELDASLLLMPMVGFLPATDPRFLSTLEAIRTDLSDGLFVRRYKAPDGLDGDEGAFLMCSFWMVEALALAGRLEEAQQRFDALCRLAGPVGLFSEEVEAATLQPLGNFPQALTHLAHIQAALTLRDRPVEVVPLAQRRDGKGRDPGRPEPR